MSTGGILQAVYNRWTEPMDWTTGLTSLPRKSAKYNILTSKTIDSKDVNRDQPTRTAHNRVSFYVVKGRSIRNHLSTKSYDYTGKVFLIMF